MKKAAICDDTTSEYFLQKWSGKWKSYVNLSELEAIGDGDVIPNPFPAKETTQKAIGICRKLGKPNEANRKALRDLYPAYGHSSKNVESCDPTCSHFDPLKQSIAEKQKLKKKSAIPEKGTKTRIVTAVFLKDHKIPKGHIRKELAAEGRIQKIKIHRNMSADEVKQALSSCFSTYDLSKMKYMKCRKDSTLKFRANQCLTGSDVADIVGNGGSLYLAECDNQEENVHTSYAMENICSSRTSGLHLKERALSLKSDIFSDSEYEEGEVEITQYVPPKKSFVIDVDAMENDDKNSIKAERNLIAQQNEEFTVALEIDREKDRLAIEMENRSKRIEHMREALRSKLNATYIQGNIHLAFRTSDGFRIERQFPSTMPLKDLYNYVFVFCHIDTPFLLYCYPRRKIPVQDDCSLDEFGILSGLLINVESDVGSEGFTPFEAGSEGVQVR